MARVLNQSKGGLVTVHVQSGTAEHLQDHDARAPNVALRTVRLTRHDLRRGVRCRACTRVRYQSNVEARDAMMIRIFGMNIWSKLSVQLYYIVVNLFGMQMLIKYTV